MNNHKSGHVSSGEPGAHVSVTNSLIPDQQYSIRTERDERLYKPDIRHGSRNLSQHNRCSVAMHAHGYTQNEQHFKYKNIEYAEKNDFSGAGDTVETGGVHGLVQGGIAPKGMLKSRVKYGDNVSDREVGHAIRPDSVSVIEESDLKLTGNCRDHKVEAQRHNYSSSLSGSGAYVHDCTQVHNKNDVLNKTNTKVQTRIQTNRYNKFASHSLCVGSSDKPRSRTDSGATFNQRKYDVVLPHKTSHPYGTKESRTVLDQPQNQPQNHIHVETNISRTYARSAHSMHNSFAQPEEQLASPSQLYTHAHTQKSPRSHENSHTHPKKNGTQPRPCLRPRKLSTCEKERQDSVVQSSVPMFIWPYAHKRRKRIDKSSYTPVCISLPTPKATSKAIPSTGKSHNELSRSADSISSINSTNELEYRFDKLADGTGAGTRYGVLLRDTNVDANTLSESCSKIRVSALQTYSGPIANSIHSNTYKQTTSAIGEGGSQSPIEPVHTSTVTPTNGTTYSGNDGHNRSTIRPSCVDSERIYGHLARPLYCMDQTQPLNADDTISDDLIRCSGFSIVGKASSRRGSVESVPHSTTSQIASTVALDGKYDACVTNHTRKRKVAYDICSKGDKNTKDKLPSLQKSRTAVTRTVCANTSRKRTRYGIADLDWYSSEDEQSTRLSERKTKTRENASNRHIVNLKLPKENSHAQKSVMAEGTVKCSVSKLHNNMSLKKSRMAKQYSEGRVGGNSSHANPVLTESDLFGIDDDHTDIQEATATYSTAHADSSVSDSNNGGLVAPKTSMTSSMLNPIEQNTPMFTRTSGNKFANRKGMNDCIAEKDELAEDSLAMNEKKCEPKSTAAPVAFFALVDTRYSRTKTSGEKVSVKQKVLDEVIILSDSDDGQQAQLEAPSRPRAEVTATSEALSIRTPSLSYTQKLVKPSSKSTSSQGFTSATRSSIKRTMGEVMSSCEPVDTSVDGDGSVKMASMEELMGGKGEEVINRKKKAKKGGMTSIMPSLQSLPISVPLHTHSLKTKSSNGSSVLQNISSIASKNVNMKIQNVHEKQKVLSFEDLGLSKNTVAAQGYVPTHPATRCVLSSHISRTKKIAKLTVDNDKDIYRSENSTKVDDTQDAEQPMFRCRPAVGLLAPHSSSIGQTVTSTPTHNVSALNSPLTNCPPSKQKCPVLDELEDIVVLGEGQIFQESDVFPITFLKDENAHELREKDKESPVRAQIHKHPVVHSSSCLKFYKPVLSADSTLSKPARSLRTNIKEYISLKATESPEKSVVLEKDDFLGESDFCRPGPGSLEDSIRVKKAQVAGMDTPSPAVGLFAQSGTSCEPITTPIPNTSRVPATTRLHESPVSVDDFVVVSKDTCVLTNDMFSRGTRTKNDSVEDDSNRLYIPEADMSREQTLTHIETKSVSLSASARKSIILTPDGGTGTNLDTVRNESLTSTKNSEPGLSTASMGASVHASPTCEPVCVNAYEDVKESWVSSLDTANDSISVVSMFEDVQCSPAFTNKELDERTLETNQKRSVSDVEIRTYTPIQRFSSRAPGRKPGKVSGMNKLNTPPQVHARTKLGSTSLMTGGSGFAVNTSGHACMHANTYTSSNTSIKDKNNANTKPHAQSPNKDGVDESNANTTIEQVHNLVGSTDGSDSDEPLMNIYKREKETLSRGIHSLNARKYANGVYDIKYGDVESNLDADSIIDTSREEVIGLDKSEDFNDIDVSDKDESDIRMQCANSDGKSQTHTPDLSIIRTNGVKSIATPQQVLRPIVGFFTHVAKGKQIHETVSSNAIDSDANHQYTDFGNNFNSTSTTVESKETMKTKDIRAGKSFSSHISSLPNACSRSMPKQYPRTTAGTKIYLDLSVSDDEILEMSDVIVDVDASGDVDISKDMFMQSTRNKVITDDTTPEMVDRPDGPHGTENYESLSDVHRNTDLEKETSQNAPNRVGDRLRAFIALPEDRKRCEYVHQRRESGLRIYKKTKDFSACVNVYTEAIEHVLANTGNHGEGGCEHHLPLGVCTADVEEYRTTLRTFTPTFATTHASLIGRDIMEDDQHILSILHTSRASCHQCLGHFDIAQADYAKAMAYDDSNLLCLISFAGLQIKCGYVDSASTILDFAVTAIRNSHISTNSSKQSEHPSSKDVQNLCTILAEVKEAFDCVREQYRPDLSGENMNALSSGCEYGSRLVHAVRLLHSRCPLSVNCGLWYARYLRMGAGDLNEAASVLRNLHTRNPDHLGLAAELSLCCFKKAEFSSVRDINRVIFLSVSSSDEQVVDNCCGKTYEDIKTELKTRNQDAEYLMKWRDAGNDAFRKGQYRLASQMYTRAINLTKVHHPINIAICLNNKALCLMSLAHQQKPNVRPCAASRLKQALADCRNALQHHPTFLKAKVRMAQIYSSLARPMDSLKILEEVLKDHPKNKDVLERLERIKEEIARQRYAKVTANQAAAAAANIHKSNPPKRPHSYARKHNRTSGFSALFKPRAPEILRKTHYTVLSVTRTASTDEIKRAYRRLAKLYHPDKNADGSRDRFQEISQAHDTLIDSGKRRRYDLTLPHS
eukprot:CFRG6755T1